MENSSARNLDPNEIYPEISKDTIDGLVGDELKCTICMDIQEKTMVTECLHRFCKDCITRHAHLESCLLALIVILSGFPSTLPLILQKFLK